MKRASAGFTVLELLLAASVLGVLLALLAGLLQSTQQAYDTNEKVSFEQQSIEAASELLGYELALAGYRGADTAYAGRDFGGLPALEVTPNRTQITLRFFEDRFQTAPKLTEVTFKIKANGKALVRKVGNGTFQEVARGVTGLEVTEFMLNGTGVSTQLPALEVLSGLTVQLSFANGSYRDIPVHFQNSLVAR